VGLEGLSSNWRRGIDWARGLTKPDSSRCSTTGFASLLARVVGDVLRGCG